MAKLLLASERTPSLPGKGNVEDGRILNFVQLGDSLIVYGNDPEAVLDLVCDNYGRAVVFAVPVRGGLAYGELFHLEDPTRPGTVITIVGAGQVEAFETEQSARGCGMCLLVGASWVSKLGQLPAGARKFRRCKTEYAGWHRCGLDHVQFREKTDLWWNAKNVHEWFKGRHRADTERVFKVALAELRSPIENGVVG
ncbi:MAG TPA: hypothetical protein VI356_20840 [Myxococcales bacterium]